MNDTAKVIEHYETGDLTMKLEAAPSHISCSNQGAGKMTTYSLSTPKVAVSRSNFLHVAAILSSVIVAIGYAGPVSADPLSVGARSAATVNSPERTLLAQASGDTMARCQQLFGVYDRLNSDGYARPLDARMALEDCRKGNVASGVAALKRALERAQIPIPPTESGVAQTPAPVRPLREGPRLSQ